MYQIKGVSGGGPCVIDGYIGAVARRSSERNVNAHLYTFFGTYQRSVRHPRKDRGPGLKMKSIVWGEWFGFLFRKSIAALVSGEIFSAG